MTSSTEAAVGVELERSKGTRRGRASGGEDRAGRRGAGGRRRAAPYPPEAMAWCGTGAGGMAPVAMVATVRKEGEVRKEPRGTI